MGHTITQLDGSIAPARPNFGLLALAGLPDSILWDARVGTSKFEDWIDGRTFASGTAQGGYKTYQDTGVTIKPAALADADTGNGILAIEGADADNDDGIIQGHSGIDGGWFNVTSGTAGRSCAFEARIAVEILTAQALYVGMSEGGLAGDAGVLGADGGVLTDKDHIGWHVLESDPDALFATYKKEGQTVQTPTMVVDTSLTNLTADTWVNIGLAYNAGKGKLYFTINEKVFATVSDVSAATFPDGSLLVPTIALWSGSTTEHKLYNDWYWCAQAGSNSTAF